MDPLLIGGIILILFFLKAPLGGGDIPSDSNGKGSGPKKPSGSSKKFSTKIPDIGPDYCIVGDFAYKQEVVEKYYPYFAKYCDRYHVPIEVALGVTWVESKFKASAFSNKGAAGIMQIMPSTWDTIGNNVNLVSNDRYDPEANIQGGIWLLSALYKRWDGDWELAAAAYNGGSGTVKKYGGKFARLPEQIKRYVRAVAAATSAFHFVAICIENKGTSLL